MGTIRLIKGKNGERFQGIVRISGFPSESCVRDSRVEVENWIAEREAALIAIRNGNAEEGVFEYLHVRSGKPRAVMLRKYQSEAIAWAHRSLAANRQSAPLVCLPTGSGKTVVISGLVERLLGMQPQASFLIVAHTQELVVQDHAKFMEYACLDKESVGIASAGLGTVETNKQITFGTIQTLASRNFAKWLDYILIDEAHTLPPHEESLYRSIINDAKKLNPKVRVIGFTATPYRLDSGLLTDGDKALFTEICYEADIRSLIRDKYLSTLISTGSLHHVDESRLSLAGSEFDETVSAAEMEAITPSILDELKRFGKDRHAWLVFCVSIQHAEQVARALRSIGVRLAVVTSAIPQKERAQIIHDFKDGKITALVNVNVLTTGFDAPQIDLIVSLRPTISASLWVQMCGRGMRISPGKKNCLVLDYANNIARHGPIDEIRVGDSGSSADGFQWNPKIAITCPSCNTPCGPRIIVCPNCGTPVREGGMQNGLSANATALPVLSLGAGDEAAQKRLADLRSILSYYIIDDISEVLTEKILDREPIEDLQRYLRTYQSLIDENDNDPISGTYNIEPVECVDSLAKRLKKNPVEIHQKIERGEFPKPRVTADDGEFCYSLLQVAVIISGNAQNLLHGDTTFIWYQYLTRLLELQLAAVGKLKTVEGYWMESEGKFHYL